MSVMMNVPGKAMNMTYAYYYYYFTSDQWLVYASGHTVRENRLSACPNWLGTEV